MRRSPPTIRSSATPSSRRWKPRNRPARKPAGARAIWSRSRTARWSGIVPCYLKSHSQGEYVFDRGWADAYHRAGGRYYPKLQVSVPFTPATGPRLLIRPGVDVEQVARRAGERADRAVRRQQGLVGARHLCARKRMELAGAARLPAAHRPAIPLAQCGLRHVRRFSRHAGLAPSQGDPPRAPRRRGKRHQHRAAARQRDHRGGAGTRSSPSTWRPARANGAGPI